MPRKPAAVLAAAATLALGACGGSTHTTTAPVPSAPPTTTTSAPPPTITSTATTTTATTTTPAGSLCRAAALHLSFLGGQAATGHGLIGFALRNVGSATCNSFGYPGVLFLDQSGGPLPTSSKRTTTDFFGTAPLHALTLAAGETASFRLGVTHFGPNGSTAGCTTAYGLQVIPPNDTAMLRVAIPQGVYECGTVTVSPLEPGTSAYP